MQIKQLKLAGFKSFVDPTIVPFSSQLVAVVGPNGCGKSNIIDAVRWVMGEGSAKTLRGASMTDVIFNGSSQRKSVGQASVELVFDNSLGRLSGQYASYLEISIKRLVTRDGDSNYYLNGSRCRRRDITDLFLGTGAGTRGYSIIGQNTISQLVEAKPEDLRAYFEEAAGVSKYKERRRETLQRIQQTRDNLARVDDICQELDSQLQRLERQAKAAERYTALKAEERRLKGDILALKWRGLTREQEQKHAELTRILLILEEHKVHVASATKQQALLDAKLFESQELFQNKQAEFYKVGNEVARLQEIQHQQQREKQQLAIDQQQVQVDIQSSEYQLQQDMQAQSEAKIERSMLLEKAGELSHAFESLAEVQQVAQQRLEQWNQSRQDLQVVLSQQQREAHVGQVNSKHVQQRHQDVLLRLEKIQIERQEFENEGDPEELQRLEDQYNDAQSAYQTAQEQHQQLVLLGVSLSEDSRVVEATLRTAQDELQRLTMQHAALAATQQAAVQDVNAKSSEFALFREHARLLELITVDEPWRRVCEWVLGESLNAITLDSMDLLWPVLESLTGQAAVFVTPMMPSPEALTPRLLDKIEGFKPACFSPLDNIYTAESLAEAMVTLPSLASNQSVITADGFWLGVGWLKIANFTEQDETSLLLRKKALTELREALSFSQGDVDQLLIERDRLYAIREKNEQEQQISKKSCADFQQLSLELSGRYQQKKQAIAQMSIRMNRLQEEYEELQTSLEELAMEQLRVDDALAIALARVQEYEQQYQDLTAQKSSVDDAFAMSRNQLDEIRSARHHTELQCDRARLKFEQLTAAIAREQARFEALNVRLVQLNQRLEKVNTPETISSETLMNTIERHQLLESELNQSRQQVDALQLDMKELLQLKQAAELHVREHEEQIIQLKLAEQALLVRATTLKESLTELEIDVQERIAGLSEDLSIERLDLLQAEVFDKIKRLGAINLMAIEEYQTELARKNHLDDQSRDLKEAVMTLEAAIAKMDRETQDRLAKTFNQVNELFQALFPRLFGGGQARLELTCDNLLEAGVIVMAQPPGKRNSTIHQLSGGEKAMTAVALVFAIFQLNPSPFCMLDEVDAPLDDLNVGRFCDLVKEMSQYVQFLLISHNKVTMELADHLIGVTMREPGVSRIVAVDVNEALEFVQI